MAADCASINSVPLNITLVASQLSTIRAALDAIADWRHSAHTSSEYAKKLDEDLSVSINCCAILITVIDSKAGKPTAARPSLALA